MQMKAVMLGIISIGWLSCTKEPLKNMTNEDSRIYITNHDNTVTFSQFSTFSISDSVAVISNNQLEDRSATDVDRAFIEAVKANLTQRGFVQVGRDQQPDLGVTVSRIYNTYTGLMEYQDYYGGYNDYYDPFYWGYPGGSYYAPTYYGTYQVTEGAMNIDILNLKEAAATNQIRVIWSGLIRGSGIFNAQTAGRQVAALFEQSPYLQTNP
jgi:hypothetical protein